MEMKPIMIYKSSLVPKNFGAITIYPFIFFTTTFEETPPRLIAHEMVHIAQVDKLGWIRFYSSYLYYFIKNLIIYRNVQQAYWFIPYEIEARGVENDY